MDPNKMPLPVSQLLPLSGDAARQAMDSLAGYDYQILRTVEAWWAAAQWMKIANSSRSFNPGPFIVGARLA